MKELDIGYELSALALRYVAEEREHTMARDVDKTCSSGELESLLTRHGLPVSQSILEFEENLGGWCSRNPLSAHGLGVYLSLQDGEGGARVAREFRNNEWIFEGSREADEDGEKSTLWGTGYPRAFFGDRALVPAGMAGLDEYFFLGAGGEVYVWVMPSDQLLLKAGSGRTLLENSGLTRHRGQGWFEVHICANAAQLIASALGVPRFEAASDHLFQWWASDTVQLRLVPDYEPCIMGTHVACRDEAALRHAVSVVRDTYGASRVRIWRNANTIYDEGGIDSLIQAGLDCEILTGPGPGHDGSKYDASLCDPKNWT
jgi:hypothetical protein